MVYKIGYSVYYKPDNNREYKIIKFSTSFGKTYAHLEPVEYKFKHMTMRVALPFSEVYFCLPDNVNDMLEI